MNWLFEPTAFRENQHLEDVIRHQGHNCYIVKYSPFSKTQDLPDLDSPTLFYGSLNLGLHVKKKSYVPGIWCDLEKFKCSTYYPYFDLLNKPYSIFPAGDYYNLRTSLFNWFGINSDIFLRPNSGFKIFTGGLINELESMEHFLGGQKIFENDLLLASRPAKIKREWRLVVCDKRVIASSKYIENGLLDTEEGCPEEVIQFANQQIQNWQPELCFVIDICESDRLSVLELNSFSCSGFYACNLKEIVYWASLAAQKELDV